MNTTSSQLADQICYHIASHGNCTLDVLSHDLNMKIMDIIRAANGSKRLVVKEGKVVFVPDAMPRVSSIPRGMDEAEQLVWKHVAKNGNQTTCQIAAELGLMQSQVKTAVANSKHLRDVVGIAPSMWKHQKKKTRKVR